MLRYNCKYFGLIIFLEPKQTLINDTDYIYWDGVHESVHFFLHGSLLLINEIAVLKSVGFKHYGLIFRQHIQFGLTGFELCLFLLVFSHKGLLSVCIVKWLPYTYWWNILTAKTIARPSFNLRIITFGFKYCFWCKLNRKLKTIRHDIT